ncbi:hypothetical protein INT45_009336 [Circinella minor]|uniref:Peptidase A2 domain-containing protein n=1 Tax=Circinella minor TaxID=1195481 RepID=A0A8H7VJS0_9FUNG|nr:hypothetical protein INT45_009336 [Circinella minor]
MNRNDPSRETIKKARSRAFHPPRLDHESGSDSPSINAITKQMQNLELFQHESENPPNDSHDNPNYSLERMLRRLIQEETKKLSQPTNSYNDRNNNRNQYRYNNNYRNNQYRNNSYQQYNNNRGNFDQYNKGTENQYNRNENQYNRNDNQYNRRNGENRPGPNRYQNNNNNESPYKQDPPPRPNSPSATLAVLEEENSGFIESLSSGDINNSYNQENEYFSDNDNYFDDDLQVHEDDFDELYAAQQRIPKPSTRQLRPRNETGKVNKVNSQKKVDFVDPPVRRKSRKQKQATQQLDNHMGSPSHVEQNFKLPAFQSSVPNPENLPVPPPPMPTTGLASIFGDSSLNKTQKPVGSQWTDIRNKNNNEMDIDSPPVEKETEKETEKLPSQNYSQAPLNTPTQNKTPPSKASQQKSPVTQRDKQKNVRRNNKKITALAQNIIRKEPYNVATDILNRTADISFGQLLRIAPSLRRQFTGACRTARTLAVLDELPKQMQNTTALYAVFYLHSLPIRTLIDSGASKSCISLNLTQRLKLTIQEPSTAVFMLGNGDRHASLGIINDLPLKPNGTAVVPVSMEVLPTTPADIIVGNDWLRIAHAKIDYQTRKMWIHHGKPRSIPISYERQRMDLISPWSNNESSLNEVIDSDVTDDECSDDSGIDSTSDTYSTDSEEDVSPLEEMLTNEYWLGDELYPIVEITHPLELFPNNDVLQVVVAEEISLSITAYQTYDIPIISQHRSSNTFIFELNTSLPDYIEIYSGILYPSDTTYRISIINMSETENYNIKLGFMIGELVPVTSDSQGYDLVNETITIKGPT